MKSLFWDHKLRIKNFCKLKLLTQKNNQFYQSFNQLQSIVLDSSEIYYDVILMILFDKNLIINIEYRPTIRLNLSFLSLSSWVFKKYFTLHCLAEIFCYYHTHLLMKTFCLHCTSRNFLLSANSTSAVQCKILLKNPCRQNFYQNLFHLLTYMLT